MTFEPTADDRFRRTVLTRDQWVKALDQVWVDHRAWQENLMHSDVTPPAEDEGHADVLFEHLCKLAEVDYGYAHWSAQSYKKLGSDQKFNPYENLPKRLADHMKSKEQQ